MDSLSIGDIITIGSLIITLISVGYAVYQKLKVKDWKGAWEEAKKLLRTTVQTVDEIKKVTTDKEARKEIKKVLKDHGTVLEGQGLKEKMDDFVKELGLDERS